MYTTAKQIYKKLTKGQIIEEIKNLDFSDFTIKDGIMLLSIISLVLVAIFSFLIPKTYQLIILIGAILLYFTIEYLLKRKENTDPEITYSISLLKRYKVMYESKGFNKEDLTLVISNIDDEISKCEKVKSEKLFAVKTGLTLFLIPTIGFIYTNTFKSMINWDSLVFLTDSKFTLLIIIAIVYATIAYISLTYFFTKSTSRKIKKLEEMKEDLQWVIIRWDSL